jgi:hypothetical protein
MIKIVEVLPNPSGTDKNAEYVVIRNTDTTPITVSGWQIKNGSNKKITVSGTIPPGGELKVMTGSVALKNTGDTLTLLNSTGQLQDSFTYAVAADGQVLQPAAFLTAEMKMQLFEELATTTVPKTAGMQADLSASGGLIFFGLCAAVLLAFLAVYVVKSVRYDEIIKDPFSKNR